MRANLFLGINMPADLGNDLLIFCVEADNIPSMDDQIFWEAPMRSASRSAWKTCRLSPEQQ